MDGIHPLKKEIKLTLDFGDRDYLRPVEETKWLGVTMDNHLSFKKTRQEVIAKGKKQANFLSNLSSTKWGIPPKLFKILITLMVHVATEYAAAAWIKLPIPKCFTEELTTIDAICAKMALGALQNLPHIFLRHDLNLKPPEVQLTAKIV